MEFLLNITLDMVSVLWYIDSLDVVESAERSLDVNGSDFNSLALNFAGKESVKINTDYLPLSLQLCLLQWNSQYVLLFLAGDLLLQVFRTGDRLICLLVVAAKIRFLSQLRLLMVYVR